MSIGSFSLLVVGPSDEPARLDLPLNHVGCTITGHDHEHGLKITGTERSDGTYGTIGIALISLALVRYPVGR
jgi:hypothetical protein